MSGSGEKTLVAGVVVAALYAGMQLVSNVASLKVGLVFGLAVDMGAFCYPLTFTLRDMAHKALGLRAVTALVWASALMCLVASGYFALASLSAPAVDDGGRNAFGVVFSPMWRLVFASIAAMVASELADTRVFHWCRAMEGRREWLRVVISNAVSIPVDNAIFAVGAFGWALPWNAVAQVFLFNLAVKVVVGLAAAPLIYLLPRPEGR